MKQMDTTPVTVGENTFYIRPFSAFKASNIFGELVKIITPVIGGVLPLANAVDGAEDSVFDADVNLILPALTDAAASISGDKVEKLLKQLLIDNRNVAYENPETLKVSYLTEDIANELFCGETQDMFILAFEVAKLNYSGFFAKLATQFGPAIQNILAKTEAASTANTGTLT